MKVTARASAFFYKGKVVDPQEVGQTLGVQAVLTGQVLQRGEAVSIRVELVDAHDRHRIWGEQYHRQTSDLPTVSSDLAQDLSAQLRRQWTGAEKRPLAKSDTKSLEAHHAYLKGRCFWKKWTDEGLRKGTEYFEQAIAKDPSYALAYAGLADCYYMLGVLGLVSPQESFPQAKVAALRALEKDGQLPEPHTVLGIVKALYDWDIPGAEQEFQRALELNPEDATAHDFYGKLLALLGQRERSITELKRALELDPLSLNTNGALALVFYKARQYDQAIEQCRKTLELDSSFILAHAYLGQAYEQKGMYPEPIAALQRAVSLSGERARDLASLGHAYAVSGNRSQAEKIANRLTELSKQRYISPYSIALVYTGLDEKEQALEWLYKGYEGRANQMTQLRTDPRFDRLRSDPRFADLVRRMGLPL